MANIPDNIAAHLKSMRASTMDHMLKDVQRVKPGSMQRNHRSGRNNELLKAIECKSGELVRGCDVSSGDIQTDTVAHCGGNMRSVVDLMHALYHNIRHKCHYEALTTDESHSLGISSPLNLPLVGFPTALTLTSCLFPIYPTSL